MIGPVDRLKMHAYFKACEADMQAKLSASPGPEIRPNETLEEWKNRFAAGSRIAGRINMLNDLAAWVLTQNFVDTIEAIQVEEGVEVEEALEEEQARKPH